MDIAGHDYGFRLTTGASKAIAALAPDGAIEKLGESFTGRDDAIIDTTERLMIALSEGYERQRAFFEPGYEAKPLTMDLLDCLDPDMMGQLQTEALNAFLAGQKGNVEVVPGKKAE